MASSVLELLRGAHEETEKLEEVAAQLLLQQQAIEGEEEEEQQQQQLAPLSYKPKRKSERKRKESLKLQLAVSDCLTRLQQQAELIINLYNDKDEAKMEETLFLGGKRHPKRSSSSSSSSSSSNDVWTNFYERLKDIRSLHKRRQLTQPQEENVPYTPPSTQEMLQEYLDTPYLDAVFTTSEDFGRRLSLDDFFSAFCNLKKIQRHFAKESTEKELSRLRKKGLSEEALKERAASLLAENEETMFDYLSFIRLLGDFSGVPRHLKYKQKDYKDFLLRLAEYLKDFFFRANPFADADKVEETISAEFNRLFKDKQIRGWETETHKLELYCFLSDRLFASPNTKAHYQQSAAYKKKLLEAASSSNEKREEIIKSSEETDRDIASLEFSIKYFVDMLQPQINQTIAYYQKKQSTNAEEALEEDNEESSDEEDAAAAEEESEAEEDEGPVYNPLNLPLGFDGRPIPYWLYKLHGLGQEFKCEICGNFSYWGRRAFERHFAEWRHSFGMRCLKIPNTTHFKEITKIEDAILLYEKLKQQAEGHSFKQDRELECEDAEGNVMSLRAFEDLRRQGLI